MSVKEFDVVAIRVGSASVNGAPGTGRQAAGFAWDLDPIARGYRVL
jgi:hypothetical protein